MSLSSFLEHSSEGLVRTIDRRKFLKRMAIGTFSVATGMTISLNQAKTAHASGYCPYQGTTSQCGCNPTNGIYCNNLNSSYCSGYKCAGGCTHDTNWYGTGCWCTAQCTSGCHTVYYVCCDCHCHGTGCTCAYGYDTATAVGPNC